MAEHIERAAAIDAVSEVYFDTPDVNLSAEKFEAAINAIPTADVAPVVHGRWIPVYESEITGWDPAVAGRDPIGGYICSACKEESIYDCNDEFVLSNYCPHCGAKMDGGDNDAAD